MTERYLFLPVEKTSKFYVRKSEMEKLNSAFNIEEKTHSIDIAIFGPSGIGKSQLVLEFIEQNKLKFKNIIWIPSHTVDTMKTALIRVLKSFKIVENDSIYQDITALLKQLYQNHLCKNETLLVFDNVLVDIEQYLPQIELDRSKIITVVTSQIIQRSSNIPVFMMVLEERYACQIIQENLGNCNLKNALLLSDTLHLMPIAIKIAISYIKTQNSDYSIKTFCESFKNSDESILKFIEPEIKKCLLNICSPMLNMLQSHANKSFILKILKMLSYIEKPIKESKLCDMLSQNYSVVNVKNALELLKRYSFIRYNTECVVPRIIQLVIRKLYVHNAKDIIGELITYIMPIDLTDDPFYKIDITTICKYALTYNPEAIENNYEFFMKVINGNSKIQLFCMEKIIDIVEPILGWKNEAFLKYQRHFIFNSLNKSENFERVIASIDKLFEVTTQDDLDNNPMYDQFKYIKSWKINCLINSDRLNEAWLLNDQLFQECYLLNKYSIDTKIKLETKLFIAYKLNEIGESNAILSCLPLIEELYLHTTSTMITFDQFESLHEIIEQLMSSGKLNEAVALLSALIRKSTIFYEYYEEDIISPCSQRTRAKLIIMKAQCYTKIGNYVIACDLIKSILSRIIKEKMTTFFPDICEIIVQLEDPQKWKLVKKCFALIQTFDEPLPGGYEILDSAHILEETLLSHGKYNELLEFYQNFYKKYDFVSQCNHESVRTLASLYVAIITCKYICINEAWNMYERFYKYWKYAFIPCLIKAAKPENKNELLEILNYTTKRFIDERYFPTYKDEHYFR